MGRLKAFDEDEVLDRAVDCFWQHGYEATSVRDLADRMGISGASLYNAYGDKRALFVAALARYADRSMRERIARLEKSGRPKEAIRAFLAEIIDRSLEDPDRKGCLLVNSALDVAPHDAAIGRVIAGCFGELRAFFRRNLEAARAPGAAADRPGRIGRASAGRGAGSSRAGAHPRQPRAARRRRPTDAAPARDAAAPTTQDAAQEP
jgi:TetR/AcrR family transcriptional repressor of nem operon